MIKAIIFDFDDTLEDFISPDMEAKIVLAKHIHQKFRVPVASFIHFFNAVEKKFSASRKLDPKSYERAIWLQHVFHHFKIKADPRAYADLYWNAVTQHVRLFPNALRTIKELKQHYKLGMISDSDGLKKYKTMRWKKLGLLPYFDVAMTSDDTGENKPSKKNFVEIAHRLNVKLGECIMVGNSLRSDIHPAKELGMGTIWSTERATFEKQSRYVDFQINEISQCLPIIERIELQSKHSQHVVVET